MKRIISTSRIAGKITFDMVINNYKEKYSKDFDGYINMVGLDLLSSSELFSDLEQIANNFGAKEDFEDLVWEQVDYIKSYFTDLYDDLLRTERDNEEDVYYTSLVKDNIYKWLSMELKRMEKCLSEEIV